jgi:hypothetical protein
MQSQTTDQKPKDIKKDARGFSVSSGFFAYLFKCTTFGGGKPLKYVVEAIV